MSLTITTLANSAAAAKTFSLVGRDRNSSEWLNTSDTDRETRLIVRTQLVPGGKGSNRSPVRRTLVSVITKVPGFSVDGQVFPDQSCTGNFTLTAPENALMNSNMTTTIKQDVAAFIESFLSNSVVEQLARGEV